ncbi:phosphohydrolase [Paenibacillus glycanilyticus]|uniref:Phosphohydrolase n=1 Tax=Paenibacillus glycanilyticus TaxID=126569 RepID=A0ABQ6NWN5_9BACL|nr:HD domain-containing protein [Paenibacillus glycanilyticus]GMK48652.1 phosphohydrolase [Paenibacillus glycanilyticus]
MTITHDDKEKMIREAEKFSRSVLENDASGHDWWHIHRVVQMAKRIAREEGADPFVCTIAALLHDVADEKLNPSKEAGLQKVEVWLEANLPEEEHRAHVMDIISNMSYNGGKNPPMSTLEGKVVQDADRLDAIGAISIARAFVYAGWKGTPIHDPAIPPRGEMTAEEYRNGKSTAINHFHEKLLKLKDLVNTDAARKIAEERHRYMEQFVERFYEEWDGTL